ncbi:Folate-biopterin transporter protein [Dioscorea alata]|uniref:Folate-biopterin transporter protein n=1 Tax=Dioscorea alata TaxID=55571 RepID=A0ACB7WGZ5_DIOAL|nr:Folate-biopterin transporter protein [Dioscorea alata]
METVVRWVAAMGFWVQGFRCFPWLGVSYYLKDGLRVAPSSLQLLQSSANAPMVAKPLYGLLSDSLYIRGEHRLPYVAIGALLQAISWLAIAFLPESSTSIAILSFFLLLSNLGASIAEVANDAIVAEAGKQSQCPSGSGQLQSFVWMAAASAGVLGNLLGGIAIDHISPRTMFAFFGLLLVLQFFITGSIPERSLNLPKKKGQSSNSSDLRKQSSEIMFALRKPEIFYPILWFFASFAIVPVLAGTMFFYQTEHLHLDSSVIGFSKVFGQAAVLIWSVAYDKKFKKTSVRKLLSVLQASIALIMISDVLFIKGIYRSIGVPDSLYVVIFSGLLEALFQFKILPFSVLLASLCPAGCEGSIMAFLMSAIALAIIVSGYLGVALAAFIGVSEKDFSGLIPGILIQTACTVLPLYWSSWIPVSDKLEKKE